MTDGADIIREECEQVLLVWSVSTDRRQAVSAIGRSGTESAGSVAEMCEPCQAPDTLFRSCSTGVACCCGTSRARSGSRAKGGNLPSCVIFPVAYLQGGEKGRYFTHIAIAGPKFVPPLRSARRKATTV